MTETRLITPLQVKTIKTLQGKAKLTDPMYRDLLRRFYAVETCKALTFAQAAAFIGRLRDMAKRLERRAYPDRLTRNQQLTIKRLWRKVSYLPPTEQEAGLRAFLKRQCGIEKLNWVPRSYGPSIICALKVMEKQQKEKENEQ
ncbi:MAG: DUF1018 domain-containing protein [Synergistaceae bacterium]|nr:DUF1018 domain-containing protein [Synergistaceae bacterium]